MISTATSASSSSRPIVSRPRAPAKTARHGGGVVRSETVGMWLESLRADAVPDVGPGWSRPLGSRERTSPVPLIGRTPYGSEVRNVTRAASKAPPMARLRVRRRPARMPDMAVIERIGRSETRPYVIAWGRLSEEDEHRLRARVAAAPCAEITVDLREIEEVTDEGCAAIRKVAEGMGFLSQRMVVLYVPERDATRSLER